MTPNADEKPMRSWPRVPSRMTRRTRRSWCDRARAGKASYRWPTSSDRYIELEAAELWLLPPFVPSEKVGDGEREERDELTANAAGGRILDPC